MSTIESPVLILDSHVPLAQAAEPQRPKVDVPESVVNFLQSYVFSDAHGGDVHPPTVPSNTSIGADVPHLETIGVLKRWQLVRHRPRGRGIARRRRRLIQRLMGALVVEFFAKGIEAPLLRGEAAGGWTRRLGFQGAVHPFVPAILLRVARLD